MNTVPKIIQFPNPLEQYKGVLEDLKALEREKEALKAQIFSLMDQRGSDTISYGNLKAERSLVVQERIDPEKVREVLGEEFSQVTTETEVVRLKVI